jgi:uncharacterized protein
MTLDLRPMLRGEVNLIPLDFTLDPVPPMNVTFTDSARITGQITDNAGYMRMRADVSVPYTGECARCLSEVSGVVTYTVEKTIVNEGTLIDEQLEENEEEYVVLQNGMLDVDEQLDEYLLLAFPMRLLCEEDCPGLCPKCGKPKREGPCGCPTKVIDPRLAVLAKFLVDDSSEETDGDSSAEQTDKK